MTYVIGANGPTYSRVNSEWVSESIKNRLQLHLRQAHSGDKSQPNTQKYNCLVIIVITIVANTSVVFCICEHLNFHNYFLK